MTVSNFTQIDIKPVPLIQGTIQQLKNVAWTHSGKDRQGKVKEMLMKLLTTVSSATGLHLLLGFDATLITVATGFCKNES